MNNDPPGAGDKRNTDDYNRSTATATIGNPGESESKSSKFSTCSSLLLIVLFLNLAAAAYLVSQQSWHHSTIQIEREIQLKILQSELESSESQIHILRHKMDVLEHALTKMEQEDRSRRIRIKYYDGDESNNVDGEAIIDGQDANEHYEKLQLLEEKKQLAMDEFQNTVLKLDLDDVDAS